MSPPLANDNRELEQKGIWGSPAVWLDAEKNQTWLYITIWGPISKQAPRFPVTNGDVPHGCIMAFHVVHDSTTRKPSLEAAWISPDFDLPDPPIVINGVLFALATGENPQQQHVQGLLHYKSVEEWKENLLTTEQRAWNPSCRAVRSRCEKRKASLPERGLDRKLGSLQRARYEQRTRLCG